MRKGNQLLAIAKWGACVLFVGVIWAADEQIITQTHVKAFPRYVLSSPGFRVGEKLEYEFGWNGIPAASGTAEVLAATLRGTPVYRFRVKARTNEIVDMLWRMRDQIDSYVRCDDLLPVRYRIEQRENTRHYVTTTNYDYEAKLARSVRNKVNKDELSRRGVRIDHPVDPVSLGYMIRSIPLQVGQKYSFELVDGRDIYEFSVNVVGRERVSIRAGTFDCFKIVPSYQSLTEKTRSSEKIHKVFVWLTADKRRIPVKLHSEVFVGAVYGELIRWTEGSRVRAAIPGRPRQKPAGP